MFNLNNWKERIKNQTSDTIRVKDLLDVLKSSVVEDDLDKVSTHTYKDVLTEEDNAYFKQFGFVYDITIMKPLLAGEEYNKTHGNYHNDCYGKVIEVLEGEAFILLQEKNRDENTKSIVVMAAKGEVVNIPSNYGYVIINPSPEELVFASLYHCNCKEVDQEYKDSTGGLYYFIEDEWLKNRHYNEDSELKIMTPSIEPWEGGDPNIYERFKNNPEDFMWLQGDSL